MDFAAVLDLVGGFLDERSHPWAVIGGLAMAACGIPRTTMDLDLVALRRAEPVAGARRLLDLEMLRVERLPVVPVPRTTVFPEQPEFELERVRKQGRQEVRAAPARPGRET